MKLVVGNTQVIRKYHRKNELGFKEHDALQAVYLASTYFLGRDVLGYSKFCETQLDWSKWETETVRFNPRNPTRTNSLILAPRETLKSTYWTVSETIRMLLLNPNLTILIVSETITNAEAFLREIKGKMRGENFFRMFGDLIDGSLDRSDAMNFITRKVYSKEANIECAGLGKAITGRHYDVVIADDIAGTADRDSAAKRAVTLAFFSDIMDVLKKESGYLRVIGTRWHREDVYAHIRDKVGPDLERKKLGKFHVWEKPAHDKKSGKLNYPRLLPEKRLQELKTVKQGKDGVDVTTFMAQYELDPLSSSEQIFKNFTYAELGSLEFESFVLWTDPALSDKGTACYSGIIVLAKIKGTAFWYVLYASVERRGPSKVISDHNRIYRMIRDLYKIPGDAFMEDNGFQLILKNQAVTESSKDGDDVPTIGRKNTENKLARIRAMEPYVSQGFIIFRKDWETAPEGYALLMEQLSGFPLGFLDAVDALQGAHKQTLSRFMS